MRYLNLPENIDNRVWPLLTKLKHRDDHLGAVFVPCLRSGLLIFGHATEGRRGRSWLGGAIGAGTGFGARFLAFALLAGFAFFIPFFLRAGAPRFAFLDFFATFNLPNRINQIMQHGVMP